MLHRAGILAFALLATGAAFAQQPDAPVAAPAVAAPIVAAPPAAPPATPPPTVVCTDLHLDQPMTNEQAAAARTCLEAMKLKSEMDAARVSPFGLPPWLLGAFIAMLGTAATLLPTGFGYLFKHLTERKLAAARVEQERTTNRAAQVRGFLSDVAEKDTSRQYFAVAGLIALIEQMQAGRPTGKAADLARADSKMLMTVLISRLHDTDLHADVAKQIVDGVGRFLIKRDGAKGGRDRARQFHIRDFNCQAMRLVDAHWADVDASGTDFFGARLNKTSFRGADLKKAIFYKATMSGTVLCDADLTGANFQEAILDGANFERAKLGGAKLDKADLSGAKNLSASSFDAKTTWTDETKWPAGFEPPSRVS